MLSEACILQAPGEFAWPVVHLHPGCRLRTLALNLVLTGEAPPPLSWLGGLIRFLLEKDDVLDTAGYRPICLLDTVYKCLTAIITDRLYRLTERHSLLDPSQEGFSRLRSTQRQVQSLHWVIQEAAEQGQLLYSAEGDVDYLTPQPPSHPHPLPLHPPH